MLRDGEASNQRLGVQNPEGIEYSTEKVVGQAIQVVFAQFFHECRLQS